MSEIRSEVQKQARNNILQYAVFRWESAATKLIAVWENAVATKSAPDSGSAWKRRSGLPGS